MGQERILLTSDRDVYIGGEELWLNLTSTTLSEDSHTISSKVAYLELINSNNEPVIQEKVLLHNGRAATKILLPDTISTGNYLLRTYTRWMTNFDASYFDTKLVSVINPFVKNSLPNINEANKNNDDKVDLMSESSELITGLKTTYANRQKVSFQIEYEKDVVSTVVSVAKACLYNNLEKQKQPAQSQQLNEQLLAPELKGEIISGTISNIDDGHAIVDEKLTLSFVGNNPILEFATTDEQGRFAFEANRYGKQEMVIQPYLIDTAKLNYKITLLDNFSNQFSDEMPLLYMDSLRVNAINKAIVNMQVSAVYDRHLPDLAMMDSIESQHAFYHYPEKSVLIDKYIELPTVEEIIKEIVPSVVLRKSKGKYEFRVYEDDSYYPRDGKTMVFMDGVPIADIDRILKMSPEYLSKIDVLNLNYYLLNENLGRLLLFFTKDGDMGNMEFDTRIFRQVHNGYQNSYCFISPDYSIEKVKNSPLADYRNLLFFKTFESQLMNENDVVEFYTGDDSSDYIVEVTQIKADGDRLISRTKMRVE